MRISQNAKPFVEIHPREKEGYTKAVKNIIQHNSSKVNPIVKEKINKAIKEANAEYKIPESYVRTLLAIENPALNPNARNQFGASGLMQNVQRFWKDRSNAVKKAHPTLWPKDYHPDIYSIRDSILVGASLYTQYLNDAKKFLRTATEQERIKHANIMYNWGVGGHGRWLRFGDNKLPRETKAYNVKFFVYHPFFEKEPYVK